MTWPTIDTQAKFAAGPFSPFYTPAVMSASVMELHITSPTRNRFLDAYSAGTVTLRLDNTDRQWDPTNLAGPWVAAGRSLIIPNAQFQASATYSGTTYMLGSWYRDGGKVTWADPAWSDSVWTGTDLFKILARYPAIPLTTAVGDAELSGARIGRILDYIGWDASQRTIGTGLSRMQGTLHDLAPLAEMQLVAASEGGDFYISPDGKPTFRDRAYRTSTTTWTFSDAGGALEYSDLELMDDDDLLTNYASLTRVGGLPQVAQDTTSQARYGSSSTSRWQRTDLVNYDDTEVDAIARMAVDVYGDAVVRFSRMTVDPTVNDALWPFVLGMAIGDRVSITRTPPGGGSAIARTCFVEGWRHSIVPGNGGTQGIWTTDVVLSDVSSSWARTFFTLDSSSLDGSHVLLW